MDTDDGWTRIDTDTIPLTCYTRRQEGTPVAFIIVVTFLVLALGFAAAAFPFVVASTQFRRGGRHGRSLC